MNTGVDVQHEDLFTNIWTNPVECPSGFGNCVADGVDDDGNGYVDDFHGWDFVNRDNDPYDDHGHGTHVAGTIAAQGNNATGVVGVNWDASVMALKFLSASGSGSTAAAVEAINYATAMKRDYGINVKLTNNSWGGGSYSQTLYDAIAANRDAGMLFVAAAGNDSFNNDSLPAYPASYDLDNIVSVASTTSSDGMSSFSNYGAISVDLGAPGSSILSTEPGDQYGTKSGTSMASPHVAGVAALAWSVDANATYSEIRNAILNGVDPIPSLNGVTATGGRLNASGTLNQLRLFARPITPGVNEIVDTGPVDFTIQFSDPINPASVQASDFKVNDIAADSVTHVSSEIVTFSFSTTPVTIEGAHSITMADGAVNSLATGEPMAELDATFYFDPTPLFVSSSTPVTGGVLAIPNTVIQLDFSEALDPNSISIDDLAISSGRVERVSVIDQDSVQFEISGLLSETQLNVALAVGDVLDSDGFPNQAFAASYRTDVSTISLPSQWTPVAPLGSRIGKASLNGIWHHSNDVDEYVTTLQSGQTLSLQLGFDSDDVQQQSIGQLKIKDSDGTVVAQAQGSTGQDLLLESVSIPETGLYSVTVENTGTGSGTYQLQMQLNANFEFESATGNDNDQQTSAKDIHSTDHSSGTGVSQFGVTGNWAGADQTDWYQLNLVTDSATTLALHTNQSDEAANPVGLSLHSSDGTTLAVGTASQAGNLAIIEDFRPTTTGPIWIQTTGVDAAYTLSVTSGAGLDDDWFVRPETNNPADDQPLSASGRMVGHLGGPLYSGPGVTFFGSESETSTTVGGTRRGLVSVSETIALPPDLAAITSVSEREGQTQLSFTSAVDPRRLVSTLNAQVGSVDLNVAPEADVARDLIYTPDGSKYVSAHRDSQNVVIHDSATGNVLATVPVSGKPVDMAITSDGSYAITANSSGNTVTVVNLAGGTMEAEIELQSDWPFRVHVTSDNTQAVVATADNQFVVISLADFSIQRSIDASAMGVLSVHQHNEYFGIPESGRTLFSYSDFALTPDGTKIVSPGESSSGASTDIFDLNSGALLQSIPVEHGAPSVVLSHDGGQAFSVSRNGTFRSSITTISMADNSVIRTIDSSGLDSHRIALTPDGQSIAGFDFVWLRLLDVEEPHRSQYVYSDFSDNIEFTSDGQYALAGDLVDLTTMTRIVDLPKVDGLARVAISPDNSVALQANNISGDRLSLLQLDGANTTGSHERVLGSQPEVDVPVDLAFSQDGSISVVANVASQNVSVIDGVTGATLQVVDVGFSVDRIAITADGQYAIAASSFDSNATLTLIHLASGTIETTFGGDHRQIKQLRVSDDGSFAFALEPAANTNSDGAIHVLDFTGMAPALQSISITGLADAWAFSPDESKLAVFTSLNEVKLIDGNSSAVLATESGIIGSVRDAVFSSNGNYLYAASESGSTIDVIRVQPNTLTKVNAIAPTRSVSTLTIDDEGLFIYAVGAYRNNQLLMQVIDGNSHEVVRTVELDGLESVSAVRRGGSALYVAGSRGNTPSLVSPFESAGIMRVDLDGVDSELVNFIPLPGKIDAIAYRAASGDIFVTNAALDRLDKVDFALASVGDEDYYAFLAQPGDQVTISTEIVGGSVGALVNRLDLALEVYDANGVRVAESADGVISFTTNSLGKHRVRLFAQNLTHGEYAVSVTGITEVDGPSIIQVSPPDNAFDVAPDARLQFTFDQDVQANVGQIRIFRQSDQSVLTSIDVQSSEVVINGATVDVIPTVSWELGTEYYVEITPGAFQDLEGDPFSGVTGNELWNFSIGFGFDFGDAPFPYPVATTDAGARHSLYGPILGSRRDSEPDGVQSTDADADDLRGEDDEDGVILENVRVGQVDASFTVNVQNLPTQGPESNAFIDAWIDFNRDGNWGLAEERVANAVPVTGGDNTIAFSVPEWSSVGEAAIRVRLSSTGGLGVTGNAPDGEVEDHLITILAPREASMLFRTPVAATSSAARGSQIVLVDLDADGDLDVVQEDQPTFSMGWLENQGDGTFSQQIVFDEFAAKHIRASDLNGDGNQDVLAVNSSRSTILWFQNPGNENFIRQEIPSPITSIQSLDVIDYEGDGDLDLMISGGTSNELILLENNGNEIFTPQVLISDFNPGEIEFVDFDRDGDFDLVTDIGGVSWFENTDSGFAQHVVTAVSLQSFAVVDFDHDSDFDVVINTFSDVKLLENDGAMNFTSETLAATQYVSDLTVADLNGDGHYDFLTKETFRNESFSVFFNHGDNTFSPVALGMGSSISQVEVGDFNGDQDLDVMAVTFQDVFLIDNINGILPSILSQSPRTGAVMVSPDTDLVIEFDQTIAAGDGSFVLHRSDDHSTVETISVHSPQVTIDGPSLTINPTEDLDRETGYYLAFAKDVVRNLPGDSFDGIPSGQWHFNVIGQGRDFGDAPDSAVGSSPGNYQTTQADGGPSHLIDSALYLGLGANADDGTNHDPLSLADDLSGAFDDENGVLASPNGLTFTVGTSPAITLRATNLTDQPATLTGWIDLNNDGNFDAAESATALVPAGSNWTPVTMTLPVIPLNTPAETVYARFRIGQDAIATTPIGDSGIGEVEDYAIRIRYPSLGNAIEVTSIASGINGGPPVEQGDSFGMGVANLGDIDGDGVEDLAFADQQFGASDGAIYVSLMNQDGSIKSYTTLTEGTPGLSFQFSYLLGRAIAPAGDLDRDGVNDFVAVSRAADTFSDPILHYFLLNADGTVKEDYYHTLVTENGEIIDANSIVSIGDLNGDGVQDYAMGEPLAYRNGQFSGAVHILFGTSDYKRGKIVEINDTGGELGLTTSGRFGSSIATLGDLDGNGVTDIAVGASGYWGATLGTGAVFILTLNSDGTLASSHRIDGSNPNEPSLLTPTYFGASVANIGDLNADGVPELLVGAPQTGSGDNANVGAAYLLELDRSGNVLSYSTLADNQGGMPALPPDGNFGTSISAIGDFNGDGVNDVIVGSDSDLLTAQDGYHVIRLDAPPTLNSIQIDSSATSRSNVRSLSLQFNQLIDHSTLADAFEVFNLDQNIPVGELVVNADDSAGHTSITIQFAGASTVPSMGTNGNSLTDGNYRLTIHSDSIQISNGQSMLADHRFGESPVDQFFRLFGDSDGDRDVDGVDYGRFGATFLLNDQSSAFDARMDSDDDGDVDGQDYGRFGQNFLVTLPHPG